MRHFAFLLLVFGAFALAPAAAVARDDARAEAGLRDERAAIEAQRRGDDGTAISAWRRAAHAYAEAEDAAGVFRATLRTGELERDRGETRSALDSLGRALELANISGVSVHRAAAHGALGNALVRAGDLKEGFAELRRGAELARAANAPSLLAAIQNETGHAHERAGDDDAALAAYEATAAAEATAVALVARVNHAALAARVLPPTEASDSLARARTALVAGKPSRSLAESGVRLAEAARTLAARLPNTPAAEGEISLRARAFAAAAADAKFALTLAEALDDRATASWAHGARARIAAARGETAAARASAEIALREARRARSSEAELAWRALLGRLARDAGQREEALRHLGAASELLVMRRASTGHDVRGAAVDTEIYLEYVDLLLERAPQHASADASRADRLLAQRAMERFKAAELRDYFQDGCVDAYREKLRDPASVSARAAVIYPIVLEERLELLVSNAGEIAQFTVPVAGAELEAAATAFGRAVRTRGSYEFKAMGQKLHAWLIGPIAAHLEAHSVRTLVFVPGGVLRTVPMAALYDGEGFLIERFAIATTPGLELTDPRPLDREALSVFLGGVSEGVQGFAPLAYVPRELESVREHIGGVVLVDEDFTVSKIRSQLEDGAFTIVHVATHAEFGETPEETFLLTTDGRISMHELAAAVGAFRFRDNPLELIMLSACDTAAGDERAALGLAGVAVKSGARSAVGTLWAVNDEATAMMVDEFYAALADPSVSRAEALRRAQRKLLADVRYRHPVYWAPFLLISNWL